MGLEPFVSLKAKEKEAERADGRGLGPKTFKD